MSQHISRDKLQSVLRHDQLALARNGTQSRPLGNLENMLEGKSSFVIEDYLCCFATRKPKPVHRYLPTSNLGHGFGMDTLIDESGLSASAVLDETAHCSRWQ